MKTLSKILSVFLLLYISLFGEEFKLEKVASLPGIPWGMSFLDKSRLLITLKEGKAYLLDTKTKNLTPVYRTPKISDLGQGGLLDVQASPNYKNDGWIYFTYVKNIHAQGVTVLGRAKLKNNSFHSWQELLETKSSTKTGIHFGSRITFDKMDHLFFGVGDRGFRPNGQDTNTHAGSIIRLNLNGSVPKDNPFVDKVALDEIYSYGHRNPQGLFYDKKREILFECEHGPRGGDEINIIKKGLNYGWAKVSRGKEYWSGKMVGEATSMKGMEDPVKVYIPSIAPGSLMVYSGKVFKSWEGDLFLGALKLRHLNRVVLDRNLKAVKEERLLKNLKERIRNVIESPQGWIYISTDSGNIYVLRD